MMQTLTESVLAHITAVPLSNIPPYDALPDDTPRVIALCGLAGSGKSTVAAYLEDRFGYRRVRMAGPLKAMMRAIGLGDAEIEGDLKEKPCALLQGKTPRFALQRLGTEWGRELIGENFWTGLWQRTAFDVLDHGGRVVCEDCRFPNEERAIYQAKGVVWCLTGRGGIPGGHVSEDYRPEGDLTIDNSGTWDATRLQIDAALGVGRWQ